MNDIERYIDSLPIDTSPERLLRALIEHPSHEMNEFDLAHQTGMSLIHVDRAMRELAECGVVIKRYKGRFKNMVYHSICDPRLLQHLDHAADSGLAGRDGGGTSTETIMNGTI